MDRVVIVGAGECGARAAMALREHGFSGDLTLIGDEADAPYERPPLSKDVLVSTERAEPPTICSVELLDELGVRFMAGSRAVAIDRGERSVSLGSGADVFYDRLLLATGARARSLEVPGGDNALTLRTRGEAVHLRSLLSPDKKVGIIGGGFIGLEVAASARRRGCDVVVYEVTGQVLGRLVTAVIASDIAARHAREGVEIVCMSTVERINRLEAGLEIVLENGTSRMFDIVLAGIGAVPNTELAVDAGLSVDDGIRVDHRLMTSDENIWAAGDCCSFSHPLFTGSHVRLEAWRAAQDQAEHVAKTMLGAEDAFSAVPWFWTDQYELGLQVAGLPGYASREVERDGQNGSRLRFGLAPDGRIVAASGLAEGTSIARDIRIAEHLIAARSYPSQDVLGDPRIDLRSLLTG